MASDEEAEYVTIRDLYTYIRCDLETQKNNPLIRTVVLPMMDRFYQTVRTTALDTKPMETFDDYRELMDNVEKYLPDQSADYLVWSLQQYRTLIDGRVRDFFNLIS